MSRLRSMVPIAFIALSAGVVSKTLPTYNLEGYPTWFRGPNAGANLWDRIRTLYTQGYREFCIKSLHGAGVGNVTAALGSIRAEIMNSLESQFFPQMSLLQEQDPTVKFWIYGGSTYENETERASPEDAPSALNTTTPAGMDRFNKTVGRILFDWGFDGYIADWSSAREDLQQDVVEANKFFERLAGTGVISPDRPKEIIMEALCPSLLSDPHCPQMARSKFMLIHPNGKPVFSRALTPDEDVSYLYQSYTDSNTPTICTPDPTLNNGETLINWLVAVQKRGFRLICQHDQDICLKAYKRYLDSI